MKSKRRVKPLHGILGLLDFYFMFYGPSEYTAKNMHGYHVYRDTNWTDIRINKHVVVYKETNIISKAYDPYCCKITITREDRIDPVTVGHITYTTRVIKVRVLLLV